MGLGTNSPKTLALASKAGASNFGTGAAVLLGERPQRDAYHSLLLFNQPRFQQKLQEYQEEERGYRVKRSPSYRERISYHNLKKKVGELKTARDLFYKKPKLVRTYQSYFHNLKGLTLKQASDSAWATTGVISGESPGLFIPRAYLTPQTLRKRTMANLAFRTGGFKSGTAKALLKTGTKVGSKFFAVGMAASIAAGSLKKIAKYGSIGLGGLGMYFLALGQAAFIGFMVGATVGGITGAIAGGIYGAQIGAAIGTFILPGPGTVIGAVVGGAIGATTGFFAGAIVGGTAGALIGLGLATNSGTLTTSGVGMATGATIGFAVGGPLGALVGATIGWAAGYLAGKFIIPAVKSIGSGTATATTGIATGTSSAIGSVASFFTGIGATIWNGAGAIASGTLGALGAGANFIIGGIGSLSFPTNAVLVPVAGSVGAIGVGGLLVGTITATSFFSTAVDEPTVIPGENEFFTLSKSANANRLTNPLPGESQNLTYTINLTAKDTPLSNIEVTGTIRVQGESTSFTVENGSNGAPFSPVNCPQNLAPGETCTQTFTITVDATFSDSFIANTVRARATPEGGIDVEESFVLTTAVGTPPASCPQGWPTLSGGSGITQGILGSTSHAVLFGLGEQAIDIGIAFVPVFATFNGVVHNTDPLNSTTYGIFVDISGVCNGTPFIARWAHLNSIRPDIVPGASVSFGQELGTADSTGKVYGGHLHYSFFGLDMKEPYIPQNVADPRCDGSPECNVNW